MDDGLGGVSATKETLKPLLFHWTHLQRLGWSFDVQGFSALGLAQLANLTHLEISNISGKSFDIRALPKITHIVIYMDAEIPSTSNVMDLLKAQLQGLPPSVTHFLWVFELWFNGRLEESVTHELFEAASIMEKPYVFIGEFIVSRRALPKRDNPFPTVLLREVAKHYDDHFEHIRPKMPDIWSVMEEMGRMRNIPSH
jgi:hypothetical protein